VGADEFTITWSLFVELEEACADRQLRDPAVDDLVAGAEETIGTDGLLSGWALVGAFLRARLIEHAQTVGCDCGSPVVAAPAPTRQRRRP
jgi:hypothetical protein